MKRLNHIVPIHGLLALLAFTAFPVFAAEDLANLEDFQQFASLIRWSGVFFSVLIIAATWLLLKFMSSLVNTIGGQFVQYRLVLAEVSFVPAVLHLHECRDCGVHVELSHE